MYVSFGFKIHGYNVGVPIDLNSHSCWICHLLLTFIAAVYVLWFYHSRLIYVSLGFRIHGSNVCVP